MYKEHLSQHTASEKLSTVGALFLWCPSCPTFGDMWVNLVSLLDCKYLGDRVWKGGIMAVTTSRDTNLNSTLNPWLSGLFGGN